MLNLPSEYAPAPPKPHVIEHAGRHPGSLSLISGHRLIFLSLIGQCLCITLCPLSTSNTLKFGFLR